MVRRRIGLAAALLLPLLALAKMPVFEEVAAPEAYGRIVIDNHSTKAGVPRVTFEHWRHRSLFSCRLCHVDVGFEMQVGASEISRATNASGLHCGSCHDGKMISAAGRTVFPACSADGPLEAGCRKCHSAASDRRRREKYAQFTKMLPLYAGGYIEWEAAEARGLIIPVDYVEGISIPRSRLKIDKDVPIEMSETWLGGVIFSHRKHAVWNGCEVCHPQIFPNTKRGAAVFSMADVYAGRYCGVCHRTVAFPLADCKRCHRGEVR